MFLQFLFYLTISLTSNILTANERPVKIAVFGDSVSAGSFATEARLYPTRRFFDDFFKIGALSLDATIKGIGFDDKIPSQVTGINRIAYTMRRNSYSYSIGSKYYSIKAIFKQKYGIDAEIVDGILLASGYEAYKYTTKVVIDDANKTGVDPDLIVTSYTSMDMLHNISTNKMKSSVRNYYTTLVNRFPEADHVVTQLISPVFGLSRPDKIASYYNPMRPYRRDKVLMCSFMLRIARMGEQLNIWTGDKGSKLDKANKKMAAFRAIVKEEIQMMQRAEGPYENFRGSIIQLYDDKVEAEVQENLSADCVHPAKSGHKVLSRYFWSGAEKFLEMNTLSRFTPDETLSNCEENDGRGHGRIFECDYAKCAKKTAEVINFDDKQYWCRAQKF